MNTALQNQIERYRDDHETCTGIRPAGFVCPITLKDVEVTEVIKGHIVNSSIPDAPRRTVPQWGEVDCHFGKTVEPTLTRFFQVAMGDKKELVDHAEKLTVFTPDGKSWPAFFASPRSTPDFPQMAVRNDDNAEIAAPYVRAPRGDVEKFDSVDLEGTFTFPMFDLVVSLVKTTHLALFSCMGYKWVYSFDGSIIQDRLCRHYNNGDMQPFSDYKNCMSFLTTSERNKVQDTVHDGCVLFHYRASNHIDTVFGMSCIVRIGNFAVQTTIPYSNSIIRSTNALIAYRDFVDGVRKKQPSRLAKSHDGAWALSPNVIHVTKGNSPPPEIFRDNLSHE